MIADIKDIVKNIGKNIEFLQPVYEAIVNSIEANATEISVEFFQSKQLVMEGIDGKIDSFVIKDNGDGFTRENINSFGKLWSTHKIEKGCKGSGRFTWLNVFSDIKIISELNNTKQRIEIPFTMNYENDDIVINNDESIIKNETTITFKNVTERMFKVAANNKVAVDLRENCDLVQIYAKIFNYLYVKLFLIKSHGNDFKIDIIYDGNILTVQPKDIPDLSLKEFRIATEMKSELYGEYINFKLYYLFTKDKKRSKKAFYCANERTVEKIDDDSLGFSASLPDGDSFIVLLCSSYFDDNVSQDRNTLEGLVGLKSRNIICPVLLSDIKKELKKHINQIILSEYPGVVAINKEIKADAINKNPYLAKFIRKNDDILISSESITKEAIKEFNNSKDKVKVKFERLLEEADINVEALNSSVMEVSEIAAAELGEYVLYRDKIIKALDAAIEDEGKKEAFIHNIFIPKGEIINPTQKTFDYTMTNLWLLDDKFMTYSYAFSDVSVSKIINEIFFEVSKNHSLMSAKKPDAVVLYNKDISNDVIVVEFKGLNASLGEKEKSISELNRNCLNLHRRLGEINTIWGYIITKIDDEFAFALEASGYKKMFSTAEEGRLYHFFNDVSNTHIYALDMHTITADAFARNKTFLDILKAN